MNIAKSYDFFQPEKLDGRIHILGCGAIGSTVAENLVRFGITKITLYDFDIVESHNIANQMFRQQDVGKYKVDALADILYEINPEIKNDIKLVKEGYIGQKLSGYVFLCVDSIDIRRDVVEKCQNNQFIKAMFDFRMRLTDAQHYAADWKNKKMIEDFLASMQFSHEEAMAETPVSACNMTLSVVPTVRHIVAEGVANFINFVKTRDLKKLILVDTFTHTVDAF